MQLRKTEGSSRNAHSSCNKKRIANMSPQLTIFEIYEGFNALTLTMYTWCVMLQGQNTQNSCNTHNGAYPCPKTSLLILFVGSKMINCIETIRRAPSKSCWCYSTSSVRNVAWWATWVRSHRGSWGRHRTSDHMLLFSIWRVGCFNHRKFTSYCLSAEWLTVPKY